MATAPELRQTTCPIDFDKVSADELTNTLSC